MVLGKKINKLIILYISNSDPALGFFGYIANSDPALGFSRGNNPGGAYTGHGDKGAETKRRGEHDSGDG